MNKAEIRKEFFKLKNKGFSYAQCRRILKAKHRYEVTIRTLKRWIKRLESDNWDLLTLLEHLKNHYKPDTTET